MDNPRTCPQERKMRKRGKNTRRAGPSQNTAKKLLGRGSDICKEVKKKGIKTSFHPSLEKESERGKWLGKKGVQKRESPPFMPHSKGT